MSKNLLEELLIQAGTLNEETEKRVNNNQKIVIENTMASAVRNFIQEAVEGEEEELNPEEGLMAEMGKLYSEEEVDADTGETLDSDDDEDSEEDDED